MEKQEMSTFAKQEWGRDDIFAFGPGAARAEMQGKEMTKCDEWDAITATLDGRVVWRRYGDHKIVVAGRDETPNDALERQSAVKARSEPEHKEPKP